jgi:hypothetical protein
MTIDIRKNYIYTEDISKRTTDPIRSFFNDFINTDVLHGLLFYTIDIPLETQQIPTITSNIKKVIEKAKNGKAYNYHNFSYLTPSDDIETTYHYSLSDIIDEAHAPSYENKLKENSITKETQIKNAYTIKNIKQFFAGNINPPQENWSKYTKLYLNTDVLLDQEKTLDIKTNVPFYNQINAPTVQGINVNSPRPVRDLYNSLMAHDSYLLANDDFIIFLQILNSQQTKVPLIINDTEVVDYPAVFENVVKNAFSSYATNLSKSSDLLNVYEELYKPSSISNFNLFHKKISSFLSKDEMFNIVSNKKETPIVPLFYKINKYRNGNSTPIQTFFVPYTPTEGLDLLDNQVFLFNDYQYEIKIIVASVGVQYKYSIFSETDNQAIFHIKKDDLAANIGYFEIPFINAKPSKKRILPVIPEPTLIGSIGDSTNIKIFLNNKTALETPIFFENTEKLALGGDIASNQKYSFTSNIFESYVVYRLEYKPTSYQQFSKAKISQVSKENNSFLDAIESNKKYYYTFRVKNGRYYSNPSEVFEVQLIDDDGMQFYDIKTIDVSIVEQNAPQQQPLKQRLKLSPSYFQTNVSLRDDSITSYKNLKKQDIHLDLTNNPGIKSIFSNDSNNTRYKVRLISKQTGKMVDVNLNHKFQFINLIEK